MTRGWTASQRPSSAGLVLEGKRWKTHTDRPSVKRVCDRAGEVRGEPESREQALCFLAQLASVCPAGAV